jgi:hypothetical protein
VKLGINSCFVLATTMVSCSPCEEKIRADVLSPGRRYAALETERDCGATTDFSTIISLRESSTPSTTGERIFVVKGRPTIVLRWTSDEHLEVKCSECWPEGLVNTEKSPVFLHSNNWNKVSISYAK